MLFPSPLRAFGANVAGRLGVSSLRMVSKSSVIHRTTAMVVLMSIADLAKTGIPGSPVT